MDHTVGNPLVLFPPNLLEGLRTPNFNVLWPRTDPRYLALAYLTYFQG